MEKFAKFFPLSTQCTDSDTLVKNVVIYIVAAVIVALVGALLGWVPVVGLVLKIILWVCDLYFFIGLILCFLIYFNIIHV
ncbi:MAG: hypothetical protein II688_00440 [Lachnospiraceae bacterium]|nr:hypothetical protein [Lachnospiraceae bacterium]MBQ3967140.1 hypothetical protein [Lachnospiraceae bacterium]MBR4588980.1 hypothetical protein [Lachnospiraceae bacterium]MCR4926502.1 hypothetical protein [Lachnospiraceae bacterium]